MVLAIDGEFSPPASLGGVVGLTTSEKQEQGRQDFRKKVFSFNGSSYSGADIKVLVHKAGQPTLDLEGDLNRAIQFYEEIKNLLNNLISNVIPAIDIGVSLTKSGQMSLAGFNRILNSYKKIINDISQKENTLARTGFDQHIGPSLRGRLFEIQSNPQGAIQEFRELDHFLDNLLFGWKSQHASLAKRSKEFVSTKVLAELQTLSISTFREKTAVRAMGNVGVRGHTRGTRTVAGSMIFTVFDRNVLFELMDVSSFDADDGFRPAIKDQLPPMDFSISFANEYGALSRMTLYGAEFVSEGQTMSIEDIILEDVCQFVARDVDPMTPVVNESGETYNTILHNYNQSIAMGAGGIPLTDLRASDLQGSEWDFNSSNTKEDRFRRRSNNFF